MSANSIVCTVGGAGVLSLMGILPPVGPGRALGIAVCSLFQKSKMVSLRKADVPCIRKFMLAKDLENDNLLVVSGPRGIGKTTAIQTALQRSCGVLQITSVSPGMRSEEIIQKIYRSISGVNLNLKDYSYSARRVIFWYRFIFHRPPIVVISATERDTKQLYSEIRSATLVLTSMSLRVCIDTSSDNPTPATTDSFYAQVNYEMEPMSNAEMLNLPQCKDLWNMLKRKGNADVVLAVCGGVPGLLVKLNCLLNLKRSKDEVVKTFVMQQIEEASDNLNDLILANPKMKSVLDKLKDSHEISRIKAKQLLGGMLPNLKGVLHNTSYELTPANGSINILLRSDLRQHAYQSLKKSKQLCQK
jgi:hypothetical protein